MNTNTVVLKPVGSGDALHIESDVLIGRSNECDVVLAEGHLSRTHARLSLRDGAPWLEDLGSTNGTFVNELRIAEAVKLENGDRVRFDVVEFDLVVPSARSDATQVRSATVVRPPQEARPQAAKEPKPAAGPAEGPKPAAGSAEGPKPAAGPAREPKPAAAPPKEAKPAAAAAKEGRSAPAPPKEAKPAPPKEAKPAASAAAKEAKPKADAAAALESTAERKPGAWADPTFRLEGKTQFLSAEDLARMQSEIAVPDLGADIGQPYLQVVSGKSAGKSLRLQGGGDTNVWTVGSDPGRNIVLDDPGVSSYHARLVNEGKRWKLVDQMSQNGTYVNGAKATTSFLSSGDRLKFGPVECFFRLPSAGKRPRARRTSWLLALVSFAVTIAVLLVLLRWFDF